MTDEEIFIFYIYDALCLLVLRMQRPKYLGGTFGINLSSDRNKCAFYVAF